MAQDITLNPFFITFDIINNCFDIQTIFDYIKQTYKKEVFILNANDYLESSGRHSSKSESRGKYRHDNSGSVVKGFRNKIDSDLPKLIENKRKNLASIEKHKSAANSSRQHRSRSRHSESTLKFEGKVDVIYIIINYPYLPKQLKALFDGGIKLDAFIAFVHPDGPHATHDEIQKSGRSTDSRKGSKKAPVHGFALDYSNNPTAYPPLRWQALQPSAPMSVSFIEITIEADAEATFNSVISSIIKIEKSKPDFESFIAERRFISLPISYHQYDLSPMNEFLDDNPGSYVDSMYVQLKAGKWQHIPPPPYPTQPEQYHNIFKKNLDDTDRRVIVYAPKDPADIIFRQNVMPNVYEHLYQLINWKLKPENALACYSWCQFLGNIQNVHAYSGQKFDLLFQRINKKYKFGLPLSFFDWQQWSLSIEYLNVCEILASAIQESALIDTYLDETVGILYVMIMKPIPRIVGSFVPNVYMPLSMQATNDWMEHLIAAAEAPNRKSRTPVTPASVAKTGQNFYQLLPPLNQRFEQRNSNVYRLPINLTNSEEFSTPYFFSSKMHVQIIRNCISGQMIFNYKVFIGESFQLFSSENSISIHPAENITFFITFPFSASIFFNLQSICFDSKKIILQSSKDVPIVITKNGDLLFNRHDTPLILKRNGDIGQMLSDGKWSYVNKNGETTIVHPNGDKEKVDRPHSSIYDVSTQDTKMIRPDGFEYTLTNKGERKIIIENEITIIQSEDKVEYDIPSFPMIQCNSNGLSLEIDKFLISFQDETMFIKCDEFSIDAKDGNVSLFHEPNEIFITPSSAEFKYENNVLFASSEGVERKGEVVQEIPPKKKIDFIDCHWGKLIPTKDALTEAQHLELHRLFPPKFFAIRQNLTATQFFRPDVINMDALKSYHRSIPHPSGDTVKIVTYHLNEQIPFLFIENDTLSKIDRSNKLKSVHIPKPNKKKQNEISDQVINDAQTMQFAMNSDAEQFIQILTKTLAHAQDVYIEDITPPSPPPEEVLIVPPPTPVPRMLEMQHNKDDKENNGNYWKCNESEFGYPLKEERKLGLPLSPRTRLFDPPRFYKLEKKPVATEPSAFVTQKLSTVVYPEEKRDIVRPKSAQLSRSKINFGVVETGVRKIGEIVIKNTGPKPLRYNFSQLKSNAVRILTVPGMITPGLTITVKVELFGQKAEEISTFFEFRTPLFSAKILVEATIIEPEIEKKGEEEEEEEAELDAEEEKLENAPTSLGKKSSSNSSQLKIPNI